MVSREISSITSDFYYPTVSYTIHLYPVLDNLILDKLIWEYAVLGMSEMFEADMILDFFLATDLESLDIYSDIPLSAIEEIYSTRLNYLYGMFDVSQLNVIYVDRWITDNIALLSISRNTYI